ncbi:MAG TPA: hypothetical protein VHN37_16380 [Actinomycetota bacterium]|nr:hypothetical protein [Actinomycetota bacterium]
MKRVAGLVLLLLLPATPSAHADGGRGRMFRGKFKDIKVHGRVGAWRPDRKTLKVSFSVASLGDDVDRYRWQAGWYKRSVYCPGSCHEDHAPHQGWFEHRL